MKKMRLLGYGWLRETLALPTLPVSPVAMVGATTRVTEVGDKRLIPASVAAELHSVLDHILFALKHEGANLGVLSHALRHVPAAELDAKMRAMPNSRFVRVACYLWEHYTQARLSDPPKITGPYVDVFDPRLYFTGDEVKDARWRVRFNGVGSLAYCVTIRRTPAILALQEVDIFAQMEAFIAEVGQGMLDRALAWAYLSETESSFEIERETPNAAKAERFVQLLHHAHDGRELSEAYWVELQQSVMSNPFDQAVSYRTEQNWLRNSMRGPLGVTYVPPGPEHVDDLMEAFNQFCNHPPKQLDPLLVASIASFGFVFIHPFMDGNGRLSRFLFHHALCRSGRLAKGFLLPVSMAIKRHEMDYLAALQTFSKPARNLWQVRQTGDNDFSFQTQTNADLYRYWDATPIVEFGLRMAKEALEHDLQKETRFLACYDRVFGMVNDQFDIRATILPTLINGCYQQQGRLSKGLRKKYEHLVQPEAYDWIESCVKDVFFSEDGEV